MHAHSTLVFFQAIGMLNKQLGKEGQKAWRSTQVGAFGDMVGRVAMQQEEKAVAENAGGAGGVVRLDACMCMCMCMCMCTHAVRLTLHIVNCTHVCTHVCTCV